MIPFRRILFPVDLSEPSRRVVPYVKAMSERFHSELFVLHVLENPTAMYSSPEAVAWASLSNAGKLREDRSRLFDNFIRGEFGPLPVQHEFVEGDPAFEIATRAQREQVDLIMMMTHGHGPFRRLLLGSVLAKVLHDCDCPVWTGVHSEDLVARDPHRLQLILTAVDNPEKDAKVVEWAAAYGKATGAEVRTIHAASHPDLVIHDEAHTSNADLVVIGRTHSKLGALRSNAYEIIRQAPCPVISV
jgi:nucleotide-binding universal stress UspA family protein